MSLPERTPNQSPAPRRPVWSLFDDDPRQNTKLRVGSRDRDAAQQVLTEAYVDGQLTEPEHAERAERAMAAVHMGDLVPLLDDLSLPATTTAAANPVAATSPAQGADLETPDEDGRTALWGALGTFVLVSLITNVVWFAVGYRDYYWPIWPMLGTFIPVLMVLFGFATHKNQQRADQIERRNERRLGR